MKRSITKLRTLLIPGVMITAVLASGCGSEKMPKYSVLQGLRVIGLLTNPPEVGFDGVSTFTPASFNLTPVISDLYGAGRGLSYNLYHCIDPGIGLGAIPTCSGNPTRVNVAVAQIISSPSGSFEATVNRTGALAPISITLDPATLGAGVMTLYASKFQGLSTAQKFNGFSILIFFELYPTADESKKVTTFKRLIVSGPAKTIKNSNPSALTFLDGGTDLSSTQTLPTTKSSIDAFVDPGDFQIYPVMDSSGNTSSTTEVIETVWFLTGPEDVKCSKDKDCTTDGLFSLSRSRPGELNAFTPPSVSLPSTRGRVLIGIAKDNRGGSTLTRICDENGNPPGTLCP
ncbi:MAG: hypothetical protein KGP28_00980 [Bdellovibrionales bacterium]|nr:hypothetical protein [Bdellovibrionales bacterium]